MTREEALRAYDRIKNGTAPIIDFNAVLTRAKAKLAYDQVAAQALADVWQKLGGSADGETKVQRKAPMGVTVAELVKTPHPAPPWLVTDLVTEGGTAVVAGVPKSAKSWAAIEVALAVATGTPAFGRHSTRGRRRVLYFFAEDTARSVQSRICALCAGRGIDPASLTNMVVVPRGEFVDVMKDEDLAALVASARSHGGADLIVLDPLRDVHSGEEDSSDDMGQVMKRIRVLGELTGATVMVVHHTAKASADSGKRRPGQRMRGSGAIHGSIDSGLYFDAAPQESATRFANAVTSEVKAARGAGTFDLVLQVEDGADGTATRAKWSVETPAPKEEVEVKKLEADDKKMLDAIRDRDVRGVYYSARQWRSEGVLPDKRARTAVERLLNHGLVHVESTHPTTHEYVPGNGVIVPGRDPFQPPPSGPEMSGPEALRVISERLRKNL